MLVVLYIQQKLEVLKPGPIHSISKAVVRQAWKNIMASVELSKTCVSFQDPRSCYCIIATISIAVLWGSCMMGIRGTTNSIYGEELCCGILLLYCFLGFMARVFFTPLKRGRKEPSYSFYPGIILSLQGKASWKVHGKLCVVALGLCQVGLEISVKRENQ